MRIARSANAKMTARARILRKAQTEAETLLWFHLRDRRLRGKRFRRQQPLGHYIVDFYCHEARLVVEVDGGQHVEKLQSLLDRERDEYCAALGLRVLRFFNDEVLRNVDRVLAEIDRHLA